MKIASLLRSLAPMMALVALFSCQNATTENTDATATESTEAVSKTVSHTTEDADMTGVKVGDTAPAFNLKNIDGNMYSFDNIKDANGNTPKGYVVTFTCNTCPYAVMYEDRLIDLHNTLSPMGYPVVAIQPNDPEIKEGDNFANMQQRAKEKGFPFLYLMDEGQAIYPQYGASRTPEIYLVDADLVVRYHGAIDDNAQDAEAVTINYVEKAVEAINNGQEPNPADVKAVGCSIKTKKI
ncbi:MAG: thioredoxin family protein [Lewinella sp.]|jgi:peroxiredoxin|uniref:thioredoxin family protein n=1 Tax=Lewinella sp. TaxID=2004506 RepID=UPI003D6BF111